MLSDDLTLGKQRCSHGGLNAVPGCGGLQGEPFVVRQWTHSFQTPVARWQLECMKEHSDFEALYAVLPDGESVVDLSYGVTQIIYT